MINRWRDRGPLDFSAEILGEIDQGQAYCHRQPDHPLCHLDRTRLIRRCLLEQPQTILMIVDGVPVSMQAFIHPRQKLQRICNGFHLIFYAPKAMVNCWQIHCGSHWLITASSISSSALLRENKQSFFETFSIRYSSCHKKIQKNVWGWVDTSKYLRLLTRTSRQRRREAPTVSVL